MRTTIDLDPDVDVRLRALAKERGVPLKVVINDALRAAAHPSRSNAEPYRMRTKALGARPGLGLAKALQLAAEIEDDEITRKLDVGK